MTTETTFDQTVNQTIAINQVLRIVETARIVARAVLREATLVARRQHLLDDNQVNEFGDRENRVQTILERAGGDVPGDQGGGEIDGFFGDLVKRIQAWSPDHD